MKADQARSEKAFWRNLPCEEKRFDNIQIATYGYDANYENIMGPKTIFGIGDFAKKTSRVFAVCGQKCDSCQSTELHCVTLSLASHRGNTEISHEGWNEPRFRDN
jgi:hypothetical protein